MSEAPECHFLWVPSSSKEYKRVAKFGEKRVTYIIVLVLTSVWGKRCLAAMLLEDTSSLLIIAGCLLLVKLTPDDKLLKTKPLIQKINVNITFTSPNSSPTTS